MSDHLAIAHFSPPPRTRTHRPTQAHTQNTQRREKGREKKRHVPREASIVQTPFPLEVHKQLLLELRSASVHHLHKGRGEQGRAHNRKVALALGVLELFLQLFLCDRGGISVEECASYCESVGVGVLGMRMRACVCVDS